MPTQGREVPLDFSSSFFMTNQYKAATELQSCIVPTDFRILCMNWPSAAAEGAPSHLHQRPGSSEPCRLNHDRYLGNRAQAGASQKVLFTVITAPGPAVRAEARRLGLESTHSLHLCLIYSVSLGWEGRIGRKSLPQTPARARRLQPGASQTQGLSGIFYTYYLN